MTRYHTEPTDMKLYTMNWMMVHTDGRGIELGRCRVPNDGLGYPLLSAAMHEPEMLGLVEGMQEGHDLRLQRDNRG